MSSRLSWAIDRWSMAAKALTTQRGALRPVPEHQQLLSCFLRLQCVFLFAMACLLTAFAFVIVATRAKGVVPLPGVKTRAHADEIVGCLGWELVQEDVDILDAAHDVS